MKPVCLALPGNDALASGLAAALSGERGIVTIRAFPDGESYVRIESDVAGRDVVLTCTLDRPDAKVVSLLLLAATARDLGAARVGLVAPYLPYLRQDRRFAAGEGVTSVYFARVLSAGVDWLITVDAHLHRYTSLADVYAIPATSIPAAPLLAAWLRSHVDAPVLVGPDAESTQWVAEVARDVGAPCIVLEKVRSGDRDVAVSFRGLERWPDRVPVLMDDIISTGRTMVAAIAALSRLGLPPPVVMAVHAVFAEGAYEDLRSAGPAQIVTSNTISHGSNAIDVVALLANGVRRQLVSGG